MARTNTDTATAKAKATKRKETSAKATLKSPPEDLAAEEANVEATTEMEATADESGETETDEWEDVGGVCYHKETQQPKTEKPSNKTDSAKVQDSNDIDGETKNPKKRKDQSKTPVTPKERLRLTSLVSQ